MNKSENREVSLARSFLHIDRVYAANTLATLHRAANRKTQAEIEAVVAELGLDDCTTMHNGCMLVLATACGVAA